jgi:hypothetical protein
MKDKIIIKKCNSCDKIKETLLFAVLIKGERDNINLCYPCMKDTIFKSGAFFDFALAVEENIGKLKELSDLEL